MPSQVAENISPRDKFASFRQIGTGSKQPLCELITQDELAGHQYKYSFLEFSGVDQDDPTPLICRV